MSKIATVYLTGGLGNQLFLIATLLATVPNNENYKIVLCTRSDGSREKVYFDTVLKNLTRCVDKKIEFYEWNKYFAETKNCKLIVEKDYYYHPLDDICNEDNGYMLKGYFQSCKYFQNIDKLLIDIFKIDNRLQYDALWESIVGKNSKEKFVSLHVRRGDYLNLQQIYSTIEQTFYSAAVSQFTNAKFVIFSDDMAWCRSKWGHNKHFIYVPDTLNEIDSFYLMAHYCFGGNIIANSTFSWWSAYVGWLSSGKTRKVVAPQTWFGSQGPKSHSLSVTGWIEIDNDGILTQI